MLTNYSAVLEDCSALVPALNSMCFVMISTPLANASSRPLTSQRKSAFHGRQLFCDDVIIFKLILQNFSMFNPHKHPKRFRGQRQKAFNQGFSGLGAHVSLVHSVLLFSIFVVQSLRLLVCLWLCLWKQELQAVHGGLECRTERHDTWGVIQRV